MTEEKEAKKGHSGSQTRKRHKGIYVACTPEEKTAISEKAQASGLSTAGFLRKCALNRVTPGTQRRVPYDRIVLEDAITQLRRAGNNLNQLARAANMLEPVDSERLNHALDEYLGVLRQLREARGK